MVGTALVAIGGNALMRPEEATVAGQRVRIAETCQHVAALAAGGWRVLITHGNGPQVGAALLRSERASGEVYPLPLDLCVASTQGEMGSLLAEGLGAAFAARSAVRDVVTLVTRVVVSTSDPAFRDPTKPIGPFYSDAQVEGLRRSGWTLARQQRGYRRLVASPEPVAIPEERVIRDVLDGGATVVALGGGGVPVAQVDGRLEGVEAVVDKDLSSALLAVNLRVALFLILTDVDGIYLDFGTERAVRLGSVTPSELRAHAAAGHFAPGSMGPKADAVLRYVEAGGPHAIVTLPEHLEQALRGERGTHVFGDRPWTESAL